MLSDEISAVCQGIGIEFVAGTVHEFNHLLTEINVSGAILFYDIESEESDGQLNQDEYFQPESTRFEFFLFRKMPDIDDYYKELNAALNVIRGEARDVLYRLQRRETILQGWDESRLEEMQYSMSTLKNQYEAGLYGVRVTSSVPFPITYNYPNG